MGSHQTNRIFGTEKAKGTESLRIIKNVPNLGRELDIQIHDVTEDTIISMQKKKKFQNML